MKNNLPGWLALWLVGACANVSAGDTSADTLQGVVELDDTTYAFEVAGRLERVAVKEGDRLDGKVLLAKLDESLTRPERDARAAELDAARAQLALVEAGARSEELRAVEAEIASVEDQEAVLARQRGRQRELSAQGALPAAQMDELDAQASALSGRKAVLREKLKGLRSGARKQEIAAASAKVEALNAGLSAIDARLSRFSLHHEGMADVLEVYIKQGEVVGAGAPALTVADLDHPYVDVFVPQAEISKVAVGDAVWVRIDALDQPLPGQVERVGYKTEFTPRYLFSEDERAHLVVRVRVRVNDPQHRLRAGVPAFVTPRLEEH